MTVQRQRNASERVERDEFGASEPAAERVDVNEGSGSGPGKQREQLVASEIVERSNRPERHLNGGFLGRVESDVDLSSFVVEVLFDDQLREPVVGSADLY